MSGLNHEPTIEGLRVLRALAKIEPATVDEIVDQMWGMTAYQRRTRKVMSTSRALADLRSSGAVTFRIHRSRDLVTVRWRMTKDGWGYVASRPIGSFAAAALPSTRARLPLGSSDAGRGRLQ